MAVPKALTIAGSDSGGGAGLQADLKTFQELGVYGMSAVTAVTAQNTLGVHAVYPLPAEAVERQLHALGEDLPPDAVKTGMLYDGDIIRVTAEAVRRWGWQRLVVDPVMIAKGGAALLQPDAVQALIADLLPWAALVTPNIPEAEALSGLRIVDDASRRTAAQRIVAYGAGAVVIKGGHDEGDAGQSADLLYDGQRYVTFSAPRLATRHTHGTGCTFAAAAAAGLAAGLTLAEAVLLAKRFIHAAIAAPLALGSGHGPTNHWAFRRWMADAGGTAAGAAAGDPEASGLIRASVEEAATGPRNSAGVEAAAAGPGNGMEDGGTAAVRLAGAAGSAAGEGAGDVVRIHEEMAEVVVPSGATLDEQAAGRAAFGREVAP